MNEKRKVSDRAGIIACAILAITSLVAAIYHLHILLPLLNEGERTLAIVIDIDRGAKNSKWPVYQFNTQSGEQVTARDLFQLYLIRLHKTEQITVIYNPKNPEIVTADLGPWIWQGAAIFLFGFLFLSTLGVLILRYKLNKKE